MTYAPYDPEDLELLLLDYASGVLNDAQHLFVSSYIALCPDARAFVDSCEYLGGLLMETHCPPVRMSKQSLKSVLERLEHDTEPSKNQTRTQQTSSESAETLGLRQLLPDSLHHTICRHLQTPQKWRSLLPGIKILPLPVAHGHSKASLVKCAPRAKMPYHEHRAREMSLVLDGGFTDCFGHHRKGDILICDSGTGHSPVADPEKGCLILNTVDAPVRHRGFYAYLNIIIKH